MASSHEYDKVLNDNMLAWEEACSLGEPSRPSAASLGLAGELCTILLRGHRHADLKDFLGRLGDQLDLYKSDPQVYRALTTERLWSGQFETVFQLIQKFPFGPSADLVQLWDEAHYRQMEKRTGKLLTPVGKFRVRKRFPPPRSIAPHGRKTLSLPRKAKITLQSWLSNHVYHPYPSRVEKCDLAELTGLTFKQVSTWFQNARRRLQHSQDTSWARSPWTDLDIPSLKRSQRSPDGKQYYKSCGASERVQKGDNKKVKEMKRESSTDHFSPGYSSPFNESVSPVKNSEGFPELSNLAANRRYTTKDRCHQGDGDTKLCCILCAEDTITPVHKCPPCMEKQKHVERTEKASGFEEQFLQYLDDNSNLQHCPQLCAVCSQTCLSANLSPTSLHITGGEHFASAYTSFLPGLYPIHCLEDFAQLVTPGDANHLHLLTPEALNPVHLAEPWDSSPAPGDGLIYTELQTVTFLPTTFLMSNGFDEDMKLHTADTGTLSAVPGAAPTAVHGATDTGISAAVPGPIPGAVHGATDMCISAAVLGAGQPAVTVDTVTANLVRDPCELTSIARALLDLSISMESLED